ncbi:MAG: hypothetical protein JWQ19_2139 [Subtercola sp.]|nr:hypothetical protein [Subtercola sp.]
MAATSRGTETPTALPVGSLQIAQRITRSYFFLPVSLVALVVVVLGAVQVAAFAASVDLLYLIALFASTALVTDFRLPVGRLSSLPSVSTSVALLATASLGDQFFIAVGVWVLGFFCGALFNSRNLVISVYATGVASLGALVWSLVMCVAGPVGWQTIVFAVAASAAYMLVILLVEFARQGGRWAHDGAFGISEVSPRRLLGILAFISGLTLAVIFTSQAVYAVLLLTDETHRGAGVLVIAAAIIFGLSRVRQLRGLQRRITGLTDAALALPWSHDDLEQTLAARAKIAVNADSVTVRSSPPPGQSEIGYPVQLSQDADSYVVATRELSGIPFDREDAQVLEALAHLATEAARVTQDMADLTARANSDSLTGLPNYNAFRQALALANENRPYSGAIAVLFIDLDSFKQLNDRHGHHVGDQMLVTVAERLKANTRSHDIVARIGGDEFVIILTSLKSLAEAKALAERVTEKASEPFTVTDPATTPADPTDNPFVTAHADPAAKEAPAAQPAPPTVAPPQTIELRPLLSVGLAYSAHRETDAASLVVDADRSMLAVKRSRRHGGPGSDSTINISPHRSARINDIVADAIDNENLTVAFQPIVNLVENRIWAFEALVRYTDPELGVISPGALVERAKSLGRMDALTRQVMAKAVAGARAIQLIEPSIATIAVNLEVGQIVDAHVGAFAKDLAKRHPALSLCLELNERSLRHVTDELRAQAQSLRELGIIIALDDYGSENSSVGSLVRIPMDILKLDRSLIDDLGDNRQREVVKALQGFSDALDYLTIVEGIESAETAAILRRVGVRNAQGFYYGMPASYQDVITRLHKFGTAAVVS